MAQTRIREAFDKQGAALMPYFTIGYPDYTLSLDIIEACVESGADLMELGMPFSDPLADGPTIQHGTQVALDVHTEVLTHDFERQPRPVELPASPFGCRGQIDSGDFLFQALQVFVPVFFRRLVRAGGVRVRKPRDDFRGELRAFRDVLAPLKNSRGKCQAGFFVALAAI